MILKSFFLIFTFIGALNLQAKTLVIPGDDQPSPKGSTYYSFNDGAWENIETWSLNAGVYSAPAQLPGSEDVVVIQLGKTITMNGNDVVIAKIEVNDGTLDLKNTSGHNFNTITGLANGKIKLSTDNFPAGDVSGFANASTGGTVEYYGDGFELLQARTFRNLVINLTNVTNQIVLLTDYTLNGSFSITKGEFHFGNATETTARNLTVREHVEILTGGKIRTGSGNARHQFNLYGNFTNQGDVQFTNRTAANYTTEASDGIVDVKFLSGTRNQSMLLEGPSRFYRIAVSKGTASTYELHISATQASYFELFGYANENHSEIAQLASNSNALALIYGTVRIGQNINIPHLSGADYYNVSQNAILWVDGGSVTKPSGSGIVIYGRIKVSNGTLTSNISSGIFTRLTGVFESTGGTTTLGQFRTSVLGTEHKGAYIQSGGLVIINGELSSTNHYSFTLAYDGTSFSLTGGTLRINGTNTKGAIFINSNSANQNINANGTLELISTNTTPFRISSVSPFPTVIMKRVGAGTREFALDGGSVGTSPANMAELSRQPLVTKGSLTIEDNIIFSPKGQDVSIGGSFNLGATSSYIAGSNTTHFTGATSNYSINIASGATTKYFHNLNIDNASFTASLLGSDMTIGNNLLVSSGTLSLGAQIVTVRGNIINSGTIINTTGKILVTQRGILTTINVTNGGSYTSVPTVTVSAPPTGTTATAVAIFNGTPAAGAPLAISQIIITNTGSGYTGNPTISISGGGGATTSRAISTTHEIGGNGSGKFGNLEINETHPNTSQITYLSAKQTVTGTLTLTNGIIDLRTFNLDLEGNLANNTLSYYSNTRMLRTSGNHSDGGLTRTISADGTYIYPLGTVNFQNTTIFRYAYAEQVFSNVTSQGKVQINGVPQKLPTLTDEGAVNDRRYLQYYWRIRHSGFSALPDVRNRFIGYKDDIKNQTNWANILPGKVVGNNRDQYGVLVGGQSDATNILDFDPPFILEAGEFTAGRLQNFQGEIMVYYTRDHGASTGVAAREPVWRDRDTWTRSDRINTSYSVHDSRQPRLDIGDYPKIGDIAVIGWVPWDDPKTDLRGQPHGVWIDNTAETVGKIEFTQMTDASGNPVPRVYRSNFQFRPTLCINESGTLDAGLVEGEGMFWMRYSDADLSAMDFGDFSAQDSAYFAYENRDNNKVYNNIPSVVPNIIFANDNWGANDRNITVSKNITTNGNLEILGNLNLLLSTGATGDITVGRDLLMFETVNPPEGSPSGGGAELAFQNTGTARTLTVNGDIKLQNRAALIRLRSANTPAQIHNINLYGNIIQNTGGGASPNGLVFYSGSVNNDRAILNLLGGESKSYTYTSGDNPVFYQIVLDKGISQTPSFTISNNFSLNGPTDGVSENKALLLHNGSFVLNHSDININLSTGGGDFSIPGTSALIMKQGKVNLGGANNGISLDGLLKIENTGFVNLDGGLGVNNYIEYSSSGNATIDISGGNLIVGSQIRRAPSNASGILNYFQTGGTVLVGKNAAPEATNGTFEVINEGSQFDFTGGSLTIARAQTSATEATLLLEPSSGNIGNTTLFVGNNDTPASSVLTIKSTAELGHLTISGANDFTVQLKERSLLVKGDLTIGTGKTFDGQGLFNLTVKRNLINNGTDNLNLDTLFMLGTNLVPSSADQQISGNVGVENFYVQPAGSVTLQAGTSMDISASLGIYSGVFNDGGNNVTLRGNVYNESVHSSSDPAAGGLIFAGASAQRIYGAGQFGRIEINNSNGVILENDISLTNDISLRSGIFQLQYFKLSLGENTNIINLDGAFSSTKMIAVDGSNFIRGIQKALPEISGSAPTDPYTITDPAYTYNYFLPIGTDNGSVKKYTPVQIAIANNGSAGSFTLFPVSKRHITINPTPGRVLNYYWSLSSSGLSSFIGLMRFNYLQGDVLNNATDEISYLGARLYNDAWSKFPEPAAGDLKIVNETDNHVNFIFSGVSHISGDYTAGIDSDIPSNVPLFYTINSGNWTDPTIWLRDGGGEVPLTGPSGHIVRIMPGHTVTMTTNARQAYRTIIQAGGRLDINTTINHTLGQVSGQGTLALQSSSVPSGNYDNFVAVGTGTIEFGGNGSYTLPTNFANYNSLTLRGSGTKSLPASRISIRGNLKIKETAVLNAVDYIRLYGDSLVLEPGAGFRSTSWTLFQSAIVKQKMYGDFVGINRFFSLYILNSLGVQFNGNAEVSGSINLSDGILELPDNNVLLLTNTNGLSAVSNFSKGWIEGIMIRRLANGSSGSTTTTTNLFPVGQNGIKRFVTLNNVSHGIGSKDWTVDYKNENVNNAGYDAASFGANILAVHESEYWEVTAPTGGGQANIQFSYGTETGIDDALPSFSGDISIVKWSGTQWEHAGNPAANYVVDLANNKVQTNQAVVFTDSKSLDNIFTFASKNGTTPLPVELLSFTANLVMAEVQLFWSTASETNNAFFTVERSDDGIRFEAIDIIASKSINGFSNEMLNYQSIDTSPLLGISYYRLKQTDNDGSFEYSKIIAIQRNTFASIESLLYPNPNSGENFNLIVNGFASNEKVIFRMVDLYGRAVEQGILESDEAGRIISLISPESRLSIGVYIIHLEGKGGSASIRMIVK